MSNNLPSATVWQEIIAPKFIRFRPVLTANAQPHGARALLLHPPIVGSTIYDVGCGFGDGTLELAEAVGPRGQVIGLDVVPAFFAFGQRAAEQQEVHHVRFEKADAEHYVPQVQADMVFGRFGTMFFERPQRAFRNLRRLLRPSGQLVMTTWRPLELNPWLAVARNTVAELLPQPEQLGPTCGPGPFSLSAPETVHTLLTSAGFRHVKMTICDTDVVIGRNITEAVDFQLNIGPAGELVRQAQPLSNAQEQQLRAALTTKLEPYLCESGVVMPSSSWIVQAVNDA